MSHNYGNLTTYEFTAFTEADLLQGCDRSLGHGDRFVMPAEATVKFSVTDNDDQLNGDTFRNERGNDRSFQTANIEVDGETFRTDAGIYLERMHFLKGSDGKIYRLAEIELARGGAPGRGDDFFTFVGDLPPAGVELKVLFTLNWFDESYSKLGAGDLPAQSVLADDGESSVVAEDAGVVALDNVLDNVADPAGAPVVAAVDGAAGNVGAAVAGSNGGLFTINADGTASFDPTAALGGLQSGETLTTSVTYTVRDASGAEVVSTYEVTVTGGDSDAIISATFDTGADGFVYRDDVFGVAAGPDGAPRPEFADGVAANGALQVTLGGGAGNETITNVSGGWVTEFTADQPTQTVLVTLTYRLVLSGDFDGGEFGEVLASINIGGEQRALARLDATDDNGETLDTGFVTTTIEIPDVAAGTHELVLGAFINQRTRPNESALLEFDDVTVRLSQPALGDQGGDLAIAPVISEYDQNEASGAEFTVDGLDADAIAEVTVSDGVDSVSTTVSANGAFGLDISSLAVGELTVSVAATNARGVTTTKTSSVTLTEPNADRFGDLAVTPREPILDIRDNGQVEVEVSGLDDDATAVITVTDGANTVTSGQIGANGAVALDLSSLQDGALTATVMATDSFGATADATATIQKTALPLVSDFSDGADGFVYVDDVFGTSQPDYADGVAADGVLRVLLGGGDPSDRSTVTDISGGWQFGFDAESGQTARVTITGSVRVSEGLDAVEFAQAVVGINMNGETILEVNAVDDNMTPVEETFDLVVDLGPLDDGAQMLTLGGFLNQRTRPDEVATIEFDTVVLEIL